MEHFKALKKMRLFIFITYGNLMSFKNHKCDFSYNLRSSYKNTYYEQHLDQFGSKTDYHVIEHSNTPKCTCNPKYLGSMFSLLYIQI